MGPLFQRLGIWMGEVSKYWLAHPYQNYLQVTRPPKARYMNGVGFEILARTPVPKLSPSYLPPSPRDLDQLVWAFAVHMFRDAGFPYHDSYFYPISTLAPVYKGLQPMYVSRGRPSELKQLNNVYGRLLVEACTLIFWTASEKYITRIHGACIE